MGILNQSTATDTLQKHVKFYRSTLSGVDGAKTFAVLDLCPVRVPYDEIGKFSVKVPKNSQNVLVYSPAQYTVGTLVAIHAKYDLNNKKPDLNYLEWRYSKDAVYDKYMADVMLLTGTPEHPVESIYVSNPNPDYAVMLEILITSMPSSVASSLDNYDTVISGLVLNSLRTLQLGISVGIYNTNNTLVTGINLDNINSVALEDGNFVVIDDLASGQIGLQFETEYDAMQALSAMNWLLMDQASRQLPQPADVTPPVVALDSAIVGNVAPPVTLADYSGTFGADDARNYCIDSVSDDRDGTLLPAAVSVSFTQGTNVFTQVTSTGTYLCKLSVTDIAGNQTIQTVQIQFI